MNERCKWTNIIAILIRVRVRSHSSRKSRFCQELSQYFNISILPRKIPIFRSWLMKEKSCPLPWATACVFVRFSQLLDLSVLKATSNLQPSDLHSYGLHSTPMGYHNHQGHKYWSIFKEVHFKYHQIAFFKSCKFLIETMPERIFIRPVATVEVTPPSSAVMSGLSARKVASSCPATANFCWLLPNF